MHKLDVITNQVFSKGPEALSDSEMLYLFGDKSLDMVSEAGGLGYLADLGPAQLAEMGLSRLGAARVASLREFSRRASRRGSLVISSPRAAGAYLMERCKGWTEERLGILVLDAKSQVMADRIISQGTATGTMVGPREVFREALKFGATAVFFSTLQNRQGSALQNKATW